MDLRELLIQAEHLKEEVEKRAEEKRRLMEAVGTFARAAVEETLDEKREELGEKLLPREEFEQLKERMAKSAERLLSQNSRAGFMSKAVDSNEIRERIKKVKEKISH